MKFLFYLKVIFSTINITNHHLTQISLQKTCDSSLFEIMNKTLINDDFMKIIMEKKTKLGLSVLGFLVAAAVVIYVLSSTGCSGGTCTPEEQRTKVYDKFTNLADPYTDDIRPTVEICEQLDKLINDARALGATGAVADSQINGMTIRLQNICPP